MASAAKPCGRPTFAPVAGQGRQLPSQTGCRTCKPGELPGAALARDLREELGIDIAALSGPPVQEVCADTFDMLIWLTEAWMGSPINVAPDEHDAIAWFTEDAFGELSLARDSYLAIFSKILAEHRA
jgi:8-oxo-dGTP diphosphatase